MGTRIGYFARIDQGLRPAAVRLLGPRSDEAWVVERLDDAADADRVAIDVDSAASWLASRLAETGSRSLSVLCLDTDGATCSWLDAHSSDARVLKAAVAQRSSGFVCPGDGATADGSEVGVTAQALVDGPAAGLRRTGVMAQRDTCVRLMLDALDEQGVSVARVCSIAQAMALAFDPESQIGQRSPDALDRAISPGTDLVSAVVLIDPSGRLVWSWSRRGSTLCFGSIALPARASGASAAGKSVSSRLLADWLAWSLQIGASPSRIVLLGPAVGEPAAGASAGSGESLALSELGSALQAGWPGASVDAAAVDDPIGHVLDRLVVALEAGGSLPGASSIGELDVRPARAHRRLRFWVAFSMLLASAGLIAVGVRAHGRAAELRQQASEFRVKGMETLQSRVQAIDPALAIDRQRPRTSLDAMINERVGPQVGDRVKPMPPMLQELENIAWALPTFGAADGAVTLQRVQMLDTLATLELDVADTSTGETIRSTLADNSSFPTLVVWQGSLTSRPGQGERRTLSMTGTWASPSAPGRSGGTP